MHPELEALLGFCVAAAMSVVLTPVAIRVAQRLDFLDRPRGYRAHTAPTPFLGGAAVLAGFLVAAGAVGGFGHWKWVLSGAALTWFLGTLDDRFAVAPRWRVLATAGWAVALSQVGLGWDTAAPHAVNVALTIAWVVGLVNAFNLMDNLDGACGTVGAVAAAGIGCLAAIRGQAVVAGMAFGLAGACAGFLVWNLSNPARIFLGDGGSMPLGFLIAALAMAATHLSAAGNAGLLVAALLTGLPILDVTLVSVSRTRRGVSVLTGGRDHLTHRLLLVLRSPQRVAIALAVCQAILSGLAIAGYELGTVGVASIAFSGFALGVVAILVLDMAHWWPEGIAVGEAREGTSPRERPSPGIEPG